MPFLGGLFSRKSKSSPRLKQDDHATTSSTHSSDLGCGPSPTTSYVTPDNSMPSYPNATNLLHPDLAHERPSGNVYPSMASMGAPPTRKKLRLPFTRGKTASPRSDLSIGSSPNITSPNFGTFPSSFTNPRLSTSALKSTTDPEDLRRLRPPPSRSAIFAAYGDPTNNPSTHSLPDEASVVSEPSFPSPSPLPQPGKKTTLFSWAKGASKSSPLGDPLHTPRSPDLADSFNLKSFRHIQAPSPPRSSASNVSLAMPVPRLRSRGESINSDSSQRISVGAFREVQARRSLAGSPSPSFRASSPAPALSPSSSTSQNRIQPRERQSSLVLYTSDSDSSNRTSMSSDDGTEDETIKRRPGKSPGLNNHERKDKGKAKSEMGHKNGDHVARQRAPRSHSGHTSQPSGEKKMGISGNGLDFPRSSRSILGHNTPVPKLQASVSTMPSSSFATVKLAGTQVALTPNFDIAGSAKPSGEAPLSTHSNFYNKTQPGTKVPQKYKPESDAESDSEDDAPLATLVGPRRPGSAMSSYSSVLARSTGNVTTRSTRSSSLGLTKPLIDINELTGSKRSFTATEMSTASFSQGSALLSMSPTSLSTENPSDLKQPLTRKAPPVKFISPPSSPLQEAMHLLPHTVGKADSTARSDPNTLPSEKSVSPEQARDALTERLSRVVNMKVIPNSSNSDGPNMSRAMNSVSNRTESPNMSAGNTSDSSRRLHSEKINFPSTKEARRQPSAESRSPALASKVDRSPSDEDLAQLLGTAGIEFMLRNDEIRDQSSESESDEEEDCLEEAKKEVPSTGIGFAPILIKERPPASSFSVTSRPPFSGRGRVTATQRGASRLSTASNVVSSRPRSVTLTPSSPSSNSLNTISVNNDVSLPVPPKSKPQSKLKNDALKVPNFRQRSSTMVTGASPNVQTAKAFHVPERPFAVRRNSPASSTEDSSSGRAPLTPRDGSDIDVQDRKRHEWSGGASGLGMKNEHLKGRSVSFEGDHLDSKLQGTPHSRGKQHTSDNAVIEDEDREARRRERRRSEAKAAIELGNVVNGPAPIVDDDEMSINHNISPRMSTVNPVTAMGLQMPMQMGFGSLNSVAWGGNMVQSASPYLMPPPADPNFLAAHQHAMMYAKQAYQMAVAQQAMVAAGDEWERGSSIGGYGGSSVIGASSSSTLMSPQFGMMPMGQSYGWSNPSSVYLPSSSRSMYGGMGSSISNSRNEYGDVRGPVNWPSSRSSYGESFGPSLDQYGRKNGQGRGHAQRDSVSSLRAPVMPAAQPQNGSVRLSNGQQNSTYLPSVSPIPTSQFQNGRGPDGTSRPRTGSQSTSSGRVAFVRKAPPPSSWKPGS